MKLYHVVAISKNGVIGKDNKLPWHFSSDLKNFKQLTTGSTLIMGRKTFESIGKPLPNRRNIVLTRKNEEISGGVDSFHSLESALQSVTTEKCFIIGGADLFRQTLDQIDGIYLTKIGQDYEGDVFYPSIPKNFKEKSRIKLQDNPKVEFLYYERK